MKTVAGDASPIVGVVSLSEAVGKVTARAGKSLPAGDKLAEFVRWSQDHPANEWVFRGQRNKEWRLQPSVGRDGSYSLDWERLLLEQFRRLAEPYVNSAGMTDWDWLALAQHHGLPTRLLDWTSNSLVACFFACQTAHSQACEMDGQVIAIETRSVGFYESNDQQDIDPLEIETAKMIRPRALAGRIVNQRGLFSIHAHPDRSWGVQTKEIDLAHFDIPKELKKLLLRGLHNLGIDDAHVMPDLDGLARTLKWQYETGTLPG
ncbi:MAG: FRG domain-containing protein [Spirochaetaceae bacterium]|nr:FRG domain-containing protein [Spirochaetaceae bacterium]